MPRRGPKLDPPAAFIDGRAHWYCNGPGHDEPRLLPKSEFHFQHKRTKGGEEYVYRLPKCKRCRYVLDPKMGDKGYTQHGRVSLDRMEPYLHELEARCGSASKAAKELGVTVGMFLRWQRRAKHDGRYLLRMDRASAFRVLQKLREIRADQRILELNYVPTYTHAPVKFRRCAGCGGPMSGRTLGCVSCSDRHQARLKRAEEAA